MSDEPTMPSLDTRREGLRVALATVRAGAVLGFSPTQVIEQLESALAEEPEEDVGEGERRRRLLRGAYTEGRFEALCKVAESILKLRDEAERAYYARDARDEVVEPDGADVRVEVVYGYGTGDVSTRAVALADRFLGRVLESQLRPESSQMTVEEARAVRHVLDRVREGFGRVREERDP